MDKENKLKRLTEVLNEYVKHLKIYRQVKVEIITKDFIETNTQYTFKDKYGGDQIGNILKTIYIEPKEFIKVTYFDCKLLNYEKVFESIEFPIEKLDKRIEHYENKVKYLKEKTDDKIKI